MRTLLALCVMGILAGCGGNHAMRKHPPLPTLVELMQVDFTQGEIELRLSHRSNRPSALKSMRCELLLDDSLNYPLEVDVLPVMTAYAREVVRVRVPALRDRPPLTYAPRFDYRLDCVLRREDGRPEHLTRRSILYLTPNTRTVYR